MTSTRFLARCAPLAIAMAALPSTPLLAQDAVGQAPVIVLDPVPAPAPSSAPVTITLPETTTVAPASAAPAEPAPAKTATATTSKVTPAAKSATQRAASSAQPARSNSATAEAAAPASNGIETAPQPVEAEPSLATSEPVAAPLAAEPSPISDQSSDALLFGLLGALGLAGVGIAFAASRRKRRDIVATPLIEKPIVERQPVVAAPLIDREPMVTSHDEPMDARTVSEPVRPAEVLPTSGAAVALPSEMPSTYAERDALLRRMVDAEPDRANPFQSPKARARRARLIMQSLGRDFSKRKPRFDLSQYTSNWPSLRGWQPATA